MADLNKLDKTILQLEKQADNLALGTQALTKISKLSDTFSDGVAELVAGNKQFDKIKKEIQTNLKGLLDAGVELDKKNEQRVTDLISSNSKHFVEVERMITSKVERFSSDIQVTIRQERTQLQEAFLNSLTTHMQKLENSHTKQLKRLTVLIVAGIFVTVAIGFLVISTK